MNISEYIHIGYRKKEQLIKLSMGKPIRWSQGVLIYAIASRIQLKASNKRNKTYLPSTHNLIISNNHK